MPKLKSGFKGERSVVLPKLVRNICQNDTFLSQLYITDIGYYPNAVYHYRERPKGVAQWILIYCLKGSGWYSVRGHHYEVKENQWFVIPKSEPHVYASNDDNPWTIYWIHFTGTMAAVYGSDHYVPSDINAYTTARITDRINIFEEIFLTLSDNYSADNLRYASSLLYGFLATFCYLSHFRKYNAQSNRIDMHNITNMAVRFMNENIEKRLTLTQIADYIGYSISQFSLIFRNSTGQSPLNYFNTLKIQRACELLETTDMKINQLCSKVGIDDSYYFSRLFTKIIGVSPKMYRERAHLNKTNNPNIPNITAK